MLHPSIFIGPRYTGLLVARKLVRRRWLDCNRNESQSWGRALIQSGHLSTCRDRAKPFNGIPNKLQINLKAFNNVTIHRTFDLWESIHSHLGMGDRTKGHEDEKIEDWLHSVEIFLSRFKFSWLRLSSCQGKVALELIWNPTSQKQNVSRWTHYKSHIQIQHKNVKQFWIIFLNPTQIQAFVAFLAPNRDKISNSVKNHQSLNHLQNKLSGTCIFIRDECIL